MFKSTFNGKLVKRTCTQESQLFSTAKYNVLADYSVFFSSKNFLNNIKEQNLNLLTPLWRGVGTWNKWKSWKVNRLPRVRLSSLGFCRIVWRVDFSLSSCLNASRYHRPSQGRFHSVCRSHRRCWCQGHSYHRKGNQAYSLELGLTFECIFGSFF